MDALLVPEPVRHRLGDAGTEGLVTMFSDVHRMGTEQLDRRMADVSASFERRLGEEMSTLRLEMAALKFDLLKWIFLFWIGQLAALTGGIGVMLR
jgi:hypothetical protein